MAKKDFELSAEQAIEEVSSWGGNPATGESEVVGMITDQDEVLKLLQWMCNPERQALGKKSQEEQ